MMLKQMSAVAMTAVLAVSSLGMTPEEFETLYDHELKLTVVGCTTAPQEEFRLLVRLSDSASGFRPAWSRSNGGDVRFALEDGTVLPHECDTWNPSGESTFWVKVPQLKQGLVLRMRCGRDNDTAPDGSAVWGSDYVGVWHMNIVDGFVAESANGYHGAVSNAVQVQSTAGVVGGSYYNPSQNTSPAPCICVGDTNGSFTAFAALSDNLTFSFLRGSGLRVGLEMAILANGGMVGEETAMMASTRFPMRWQGFRRGLTSQTRAHAPRALTVFPFLATGIMSS